MDSPFWFRAFLLFCLLGHLLSCSSGGPDLGAELGDGDSAAQLEENAGAEADESISQPQMVTGLHLSSSCKRLPRTKDAPKRIICGIKDRRTGELLRSKDFVSSARAAAAAPEPEVVQENPLDPLQLGVALSQTEESEVFEQLTWRVIGESGQAIGSSNSAERRMLGLAEPSSSGASCAPVIHVFKLSKTSAYRSMIVMKEPADCVSSQALNLLAPKKKLLASRMFELPLSASRHPHQRNASSMG